MKSEFCLFQNLSGTFNGFSAILVSCVFNPCRMKNGRPLKMPDHLCWRISRGGLPLNLQDLIVQRQKTLNLADFILILADLICERSKVCLICNTRTHTIIIPQRSKHKDHSVKLWEFRPWTKWRLCVLGAYCIARWSALPVRRLARTDELGSVFWVESRTNGHGEK